MPNALSLSMSAAALVISAVTAWLTLFRPGRIMMTQPTLFYLGPDGTADGKGAGPPKVYVRTLLYSTAKRGNLVENMYVTVQKGETRQNFSIWVYRQAGQLSRGSGLFVSQDGIALDHHFLLPSDGTTFLFDAGDYRIEVYAKLVASPKPRLLATVSGHLSPTLAGEAASNRGGVFFNWGPDRGAYHASTRQPPASIDGSVPLEAALSLLEAFGSTPGQGDRSTLTSRS